MALNPKQISLRDVIWNSSSPHSVSHVSSNLWWFFHEENFWYVMCNFIWCFGNLIYPFTILCFSQQRYKNSFRKVAENIFIPVKHKPRHQRHNKVKMLTRADCWLPDAEVLLSQDGWVLPRQVPQTKPGQNILWRHVNRSNLRIPLIYILCSVMCLNSSPILNHQYWFYT